MMMLAVGGGTATAQTDSNQQATAVVSMGTTTAAADCVIKSVSGDNAAFACWQHDGDHLYNCDNASDGHHPVVFYYRSTSPDTLRSFSDSVGAGGCVDHNLDIPESGWIRVKACNYEGDTRLSCDSAYRYAYGNR
jgi:hypothetical protein